MAPVRPRSAVHPSLFILLAALVAPMLGGCASTGGLGGTHVIVELFDAQNGVHLALADEANPDQAGQYYSELRADATMKLAREEIMGALLADLDGLGFAEAAAPGAPPEMARGWVSVRRGSAQQSFVVPIAGATADQLMRFAEMKLLLDDYYGRIGALQYVENPRGALTLREEQNRIGLGGRP